MRPQDPAVSLQHLALLLALVIAAGACSSPTASAPTDPSGNLGMSQAELQGGSLDQLRNANWDCQQRGPSAIACAPPGIGLPPVPPLGENGQPVYELSIFALDGTPLGTTQFVRADLYNGRTCAFTGQPYVFRAIIGYYECFRPS